MSQNFFTPKNVSIRKLIAKYTLAKPAYCNGHLSLFSVSDEVQVKSTNSVEKAIAQ